MELLIVIAVIGILAAALLVAIDPVDKIRAGNDSKVLGDVRQVYDAALRAYASGNVMPTSIAGSAPSITTIGELRNEPKPPATYGTNYTYAVNSASDDVCVSGRLMSKGQIAKAAAASVVGTSANLWITVNNGKTCYSAGASAPGCTSGPATCP